MRSYFAYIRVSTVKQGEHGSSLQEQRDAIEAYARRFNLTISGWFEEMETAAKQGRSAFNRMLLELERGKAAGVIIHKIDRSARNLRDWARLGELLDHGADIRFVHDNLDLATRGGRLSADIQAVVAADFIRNLRDEVRKGQRGQMKQGLYPFKAPRGYLDCGKGKPKSVDPTVGPLVKQAFELYGTGTFSLHKLRFEMERRGLRSVGGGPLGLNAVSLMLRNPFYTGLIQLRGSSETYEGVHEPLVSRRLFDRVQSILTGRLHPRVEIHQFLFRRLITCARCGRSLTGESQKGHVYYRCHELSCPRISFTEDLVDGLARQSLGRLRLDDRDMRDFRDIVQEIIADEKDQTEDAARHKERDLALVDARLSRLTDAFVDGLIDKDAYDERRRRLLERRLELRETAVEASNLTPAQSVAESFERGFTALQRYESASDDVRREILKSVGSNFLADRNQLVFPMFFPFAEVEKWHFDQGGAPHQDTVRIPSRDKRKQLVRSFIRSLLKTMAMRSAHNTDPTTGAGSDRR